MRFIGRKGWPFRNSIFKFIKQRDWEEVWRILKFWKQWILMGFSEDELWSLDVTLAQFILPRLKYFRDWEIRIRPMDDPKYKKWIEELDKMIDAIDLVSNTNCGWSFNTEQSKIVGEGMKLFGKRFTKLCN